MSKPSHTSTATSQQALLGRFRFVLLALAMVLITSSTWAQSIVYDAIPSTLAPNYTSLGFQATQTREFGDYVHLSGTNRVLNTVDVTMSAWARQADWPSVGGPSGWNHNFTINIYNVVPGAPLNTKGSLIATVTQSKLVPWRPVADPTCPASGFNPWRAADGSCYNGYAFNLSFDMSSLNVTLPNDIIIGIQYSTGTYGFPPMGVGGPYDSLNVALVGSPAAVGSDANTDRLFWDTTTAGNYTDSGAAGIGIFREDTVWGPSLGTVPFRVTANPGALPPSADVVYVNTAWTGTTPGTDPDGAGPATNFGVLSFATIQDGINGVNVGGTVHVAAGNYPESVSLNKTGVSLKGAGIDQSFIIGPHNSGGANTLLMNASGALVEGFTITRSGNTVGSWGTNLKNQGVSMSSPGTDMTIQNCKVTGNRNGIYVGQSSHNNTIRRNIVDFNRTGIHLVDHNGDLIEENVITNNWTMGILYRTEGGPAPTGLTVRNNNITGNWYSEIEFREPAAGANLNMSGNYLGATITRTTAPSGEPGYSVQIPVAFGGSAVAPASHPTVAGVESARVDYSPYLNSGADTSAAPGFQGDYSNISVTADAAQFGTTSRIQEGISLVTVGGSLNIGAGTYAGNVTVSKAVNLKGDFTISGSLSTTAVGASVSPGNSPGIINSGNLTLGPGSTTNMELNGTAVGTQYDQLNVTGSVTISPTASLNPTLGFTPAAGNAFTIINNDGGDAVSGTFAGLPEGTVFYVGTTSLRISYIGGDGNDVVLTVVVLCNAVSIPTNINTLAGNTNVVVPVNVNNTTGNGLVSTDFTLNYNPAVLGSPVVTLGSVPAGATMTVTTPTPGVITVSIYSSTPFTGAGTLATVTFTAVGPIGSSTPVSFGSFMFNEGTACISTTNGSVNIISGTISGAVTYRNSSVPLGVDNVVMNAAGAVNVSTSTAAGTGAYSLSGLGNSSYVVTPSKSNEPYNSGVLSGLDSARIAQHVVGMLTAYTPFNPAGGSYAAADVSGNGTITSFDAALVARYAVNLPGAGSSGTWRFVPVNRSYTLGQVQSGVSGENYQAILMGDVTGNWGGGSTPTRPATADGERPMTVSAPTIAAAPGTEVVVPVAIQNTTGKDIVAYTFDLRYDPAVLEPTESTIDLAGTISDGYTATVNTEEAGKLRIVVFGTMPLNGAGELLKLKFNVIGQVDSETALTWETFEMNEGGISFETRNGSLRVQDASTSDRVRGRVLDVQGNPIAGARVILTDTVGERRSVVTSSLGSFEFAQLTTGQAYALSVSAKGFSFASQTVTVGGTTANVDLVARP